MTPAPGAFSDAAVQAGVVGLADAFRTRRLSPAAVAARYLDRIDRYDGRLGAFLDLDRTGATIAAAASESRWRTGRERSAIDGVPIAVKGNIAVAGLPWTGGIGAYRDRIAEEDAACVARLRSAGCVVLGTLAMHEGALGLTNDNPWFGRCDNPHRPGFVPGGSSGGAAAAMAAGLCAAALGTDTLGSVRIPAAHCGVVGYKPARDAIARGGVMALAPTFDHVGMLARSVADCIAVMAIFDAAAAGPHAPPARIGVLAPATSAEVTETMQAIDGIVSRLAAMGKPVLPIAAADLRLAALRKPGLIVTEVEAAAVHEVRRAASPGGFSPEFAAMLEYGARLTPDRVALARAAITEIVAAAERTLAPIDALILPVTPQPAFPADGAVPDDHADLTSLAAMLGWPAIAIPAVVDRQRLPLSVQIVGRHQAHVLGLAEIVEKLAPGVPVPLGYRA